MLLAKQKIRTVRELDMFSQMIIIKPTMTNPNIIISKDIFPKLHRLFASNGNRFGITFPAYSFRGHGKLGSIVEILCEDREALAKLNLVAHFKEFEDIKVMNNINETDDYKLFRRVREKARFEKYAERYQNRGHGREIPSTMKAHNQHFNKRVFSNAYITVSSASTGQKYNIFIEPVETDNIKFNAYGLIVS